MKKLWFAAMPVLLAVLCTLSAALAEQTADGLLYNVYEGKAAITGYSGTAEELNIPETIGGYPVMRIDDYAFYDCDSLTVVHIPDGISGIGEGVFSECSALTRVSIPDGVTSIGYAAFYGCTSLPRVDIPDGATSIGEYAFYGCSALTCADIPAGVTSIGAYAFYDCNSLTSVSIPGEVSSIGAKAFTSEALSKVYLSENVEGIAENAFVAGSSASCVLYCPYYCSAYIWAGSHGWSVVFTDGKDFEDLNGTAQLFDLRLPVGSSRQMPGDVFPRTAELEYRWSSSAPELVSVDEKGRLTAHANGTAVIMLTIDGVSAAAEVTAYTRIDDFALKPDERYILLDSTLQLQPSEVTPEGWNEALKWSSDKPLIAAVSDGGLVTGRALGEAGITAATERGLRRSVAIHVCSPVTAIALAETSLQLCVGTTGQITANVSTQPEPVVNQLVTFTSSDEAVATVSADGVVTGVGTGSAVIRVTAESGVQAQCNVNIAHTPALTAVVPATTETDGAIGAICCSLCGTELFPAVTISRTSCIVLPADTERIESEAFTGAAMQQITLPEGAQEIGAKAFASCAQLRLAVLPESVQTIAADAFAGCTNTVIYCKTGSAAERFAIDHGMCYLAQ